MQRKKSNENEEKGYRIVGDLFTFVHSLILRVAILLFSIFILFMIGICSGGITQLWRPHSDVHNFQFLYLLI